MIGLTIAGFDPSGGAGISTDIKTMAAHGVHGCAVVTALTAQNPKKVFSVEPVTLHSISQQIDSIFDEYAIKYSKTGLLYSKEIIQLVSKKVEEYDLSIVVDPVMVASAGDALGKSEIADALKEHLLEKTVLVTPNVSEAEKLSNMKIENVDDAKEAAYKIGEYCNVMITGGHLNGTNIIYNKEKDELSTLHQDLIKTDNLHGTGCSLSAAICANLILLNEKDENSSDDDNLKTAIERSTKFIYESVRNGRYGTLNPNFNSKLL
ncbi:bifunctional hydroxymethylpyrimidine kinase/phosphomethylpyrimidine kinase [Methanobrevibacter sp.]|uniref:bifunctional hydroxymethylpyrimidine kinase/phosphomethylpyrimidine kinase n=1 Tax=Methanobrevibacter sp. TaxID=66852 RepID=UPI0025D136DC|nr:bifunctional hydroxymethylpyrimidine kinase/phosphomethylpyrimidine kinase [Methanobrevibacter sp.]MBQ2962281.1 bifunctional hydroxymethylpyrimidine kinase/phosphomethylpyrimidine kinase [Methanobrevibacter sp.]